MTSDSLPALKRNSRRREYDLYSMPQRKAVVEGWLFQGATNRDLDEQILGLDRDVSHGYQSMGILHFLGLRREAQGLFKSVPFRDAIELMRMRADWDAVVSHLEWVESALPWAQFDSDTARDLETVRNFTSEEILRKVQDVDPVPERVPVMGYVFRCSPLVAISALSRAAGICERCKNPAPFTRATDGTPFLEIHYKVSLRNGGLDTVDNVEALCPNCHRFVHHGLGQPPDRSCGVTL
jgi:5-methylcytosine-specific restriction protein A